MTEPIEYLMRKCPSCDHVFLENSDERLFFIVNPGMIWTDGDDCDDIQIEDELHQCRKCSSIFYTKQAEIVGIDNVDSIEGEINVSEYYQYFNIPSIDGFMGSSKKHKNFGRYYIALKGMPKSFNGFSEHSEFMANANSIDYYRAIDLRLFSSVEQELNLRIKAWWNDKKYSEEIRRITVKNFKKCNSEDNDLLRSSSLSAKAEDNIKKMLDLIDLNSMRNADYLPYKIMRSDMLRRLGMFDDCTNFLKNNLEQSDLDRLEYKDAIETILVSCREKIRCARRTGFEKPWASGPVFYI